MVISAFTQPGLRLESPPPVITGKDGQPQKPEVVLRDVAGKELPNHAIVDLKVEPALQAGPRSFAFTVTVRNFSSKDVNDLEVSLLVSGQVKAKGFLSLAPGATAQKTLTYRFDQGGPAVATVQLKPDALAEDDWRTAIVQVPKDVAARS